MVGAWVMEGFGRDRVLRCFFYETLAWQWGGELWAFPSRESGELR
jgi:hypothetical protein